MKMHNEPHSWTEFIELLHSWWRSETPMGVVLLSVVMAAMRIAYGDGGWEKMILEGAICGALTLTRRDDRRGRGPKFNQPGLFEVLP